MLENDIGELHLGHIRDGNRPERTRFFLDLEDGLKVVERHLRLAIDVHHVSDFLQRTENEERVNPTRKELPDGDFARVDQVQHQSQNRSPECIYASTLNEAEAA